MQPLVDIALVMLTAGALGGLVNYFLSDPEQEKRLAWWQHVFVGVAASFMVPLFLNMISGDLIDKIRGTTEKPGDYSKLFVLAGFCLVAAVSSRAFIKSLSERVLQEVKKKVDAVGRTADKAAEKADSAKAQATAASVDANEARQAVAPFVEDESIDTATESQLSQESIVKLQRSLATSETLPSNEVAVLKAMKESQFSLRSMTGIAKDANLSKPFANEAITSLLSRGLLGEAIGKAGQPRWFITQAGRAASLDD
nr:YEATS-associated helix-containing protein [uncultured Roseateles sp.]